MRTEVGLKFIGVRDSVFVETEVEFEKKFPLMARHAKSGMKLWIEIVQ